MKRILITALALAAAPALALAAGDTVKTGENAVTGGHSKEKAMTEKLGEAVPTMTSEEKPMEESKAPESQTYTDTIGKTVPEMTAPSDGKQ